MPLTKSNKTLIVFFIAVFLINFTQSLSTELLGDEAYYWVYSNFLDWGYFDHPPMVALWIFISKTIFGNIELGVRFFSTISICATYYLIWLTIENPKKKEHVTLFSITCFSFVLLNIFGFITVPDTPLLFFLALFLFGYQKFLKNKSFKNGALVTLAISGMLYSKYHAVLIVGFVVLSNLKLLKEYKTWLITLGIIILCFPHLFWQYKNDFISFTFHLGRSSKSTYKFENTYMFFVNAIAIVGLTFPIVYKSFFKNLTSKDLFQKALNYICIGFLAFFFYTSFKMPTQAQWNGPILIPLAIITFNYLLVNEKSRKTFSTLGIMTISLLMILRVLITTDEIFGIQLEMQGNKKWVTALHEKVKNEKVLFKNSYTNTSWYWFYSGQQPYEYNTWYKRKSQYNLYDYNKNVKSEEIILINNRRQGAFDSITTKHNKRKFLKRIKNYQKEGVIMSSNKVLNLEQNQINNFDIKIENPNNIDLKKLKLHVVFRDKNYKGFKKEGSKNETFFKASLTENQKLEFKLTENFKGFTPTHMQILGNYNIGTSPVEVGYIECQLKE